MPHDTILVFERALSPGPKENDVPFLNEIHHLQKAIEECLYLAMDDFRLRIVTD